MKIVHLIDYFQPALGYQETFLAREQLRLGHEVTVVTSDRYAPFPDYERTSRPVLGERIRTPGPGREEDIPVLRLPVRFERASRCWLQGLGAALQELHPDVVHAHGIIKLSSVRAAWLKPRVGYRLLIDDHMHRVNLNAGRTGRLFYWMFRRCCAPLLRRRADAFTAITEETRGIVQKVYGLSDAPVRVIELGVDTEQFCRNEEAGQALRRELGFGSEDFVILYTGKGIPEKAPHWLLEALPLGPPEVKALLVGNIAADYRREIDRILAAHGLEARVVFRPAVRQADLPVYYSAADAGCWPREASIAMLEAAACSLPIIISQGGLEERIRYGNGLEYPEGDVEALGRCIGELAGRPERARAMGAEGRRLVEEHYSWKEINRQFLELYQAE